MHCFVAQATLFRPRCPLPVLALLILVTCAVSAGAQNAGKDAKAPPAPTKVTQAYRGGSNQDTPVQLGDDLVVEVENLDALLEKARATSPAKKILLFLDGRPL